MASTQEIQVHRYPQTSYISSVRFLPSQSLFNRRFIFSSSSNSSHSLNIQSLENSSSTWLSPSRITSFSPSPSLVAASTSSGSLHFVSVSNGVFNGEEMRIKDLGFHFGGINCVDLNDNECVSVGEDGRVNLVKVGSGGNGYRRVWDSEGLVGYECVKWASGNEFVTGGFGFGLQWWDARKPGGPSAQFKPNWPNKATSGIVHSIDIHQSRKHTCLAGCSSGTVFAWDLRWQNQPIALSGFGTDERKTNSPCESDVWRVQYDNYTSSSSRILPAMICSEDGILAVIEEGEDPYELLAEPCAINSFDIDQQNPSDVICSLEWESIALVTRP